MSVFWRPRGCVLWYDFATLSGDTAYDLSGQGNNGTIVDGTWGRGPLVGALSFDGVDDYVEVPDAPEFNAQPKLSCEALLRIKGFPYTAANIMIKNIVWANAVRKWDADVWRVSANIGTGTSWGTAVTFPKNLALQKWYHLVFIYEAPIIKCYVNGVYVGEGDTGVTMGENTNPVWLGANVAAALYIQGDIAFARIYNRVLTEREIKAHYRYLKYPIMVAP